MQLELPKMKRKNAFASWCAWLALALAPCLTPFAAEPGPSGRQTGSISGRVQNAATKAYLEGATVVLEPTRQSTLTSRDGSFDFSSLPPGDYRVSISYTALDTQAVAVSLAAGQSVTREIALTSQ